jgi:hypothetical protein
MSPAPLRTRRRLPHELRLGRRTLLRGAAAGAVAVVAVPRLAAMLNDHGTAYADGTPLPRRLLFWMFGNGCRLEHWTPKEQGPSWVPTPELAPIAPYKSYCTVLTGFKNYVAGRRGHHDGMVGMMSGIPFIQLDPMGAPYASKFGGPSGDQIVADIVGIDTFHRSLQVGVTQRHLTDQGPTLQTMSHRGPDQPLAMERDPQGLYDKLFNAFMPADDPARALRASALDVVLGDVQRLKQRVGKGDQIRLDAHIESLFQLQKQILAIPPTCDLPPKPAPLGMGPDEPLAEINAVMAELVALAFACDLTRVCTFMFTGPSGAQQYNGLGPSAFPEHPGATDYSHADQHQISHVNLPYEQDFIHKSTMVNMEGFAAMLDRFQATEQGAGNLLDHACILMFSDVTEGWSHSEDDYPLVVAGRAGGRLKENVGHYRSPGAESLSNVLLACMKSVLPNPDAVTEVGADEGTYTGRSATPCAAIYA